jgi:hypothetical protein
MPMLILFVFLTGALLGMRFKVLILIPAVGIAVIAVLWAGALRGDAASAISLAAALAWAGLQFGYICGSAAQYRIALARRPRKVLLRANEPTQAS